ncbi:MAG: hypothetical protein AMXMBFR33_56790 [Candidatus Xenobia bacterium]
MEQPVNPARHLENLVEEVLAQKIFAVDFAYGFTRLERHLAGVRQWLAGRELEGLDELEQAMASVRAFVEQKSLGDLDRGLATARRATWMLEQSMARAELEGNDLPERLRIAPGLQREWQERWSARVFRHQGESRMVFACKQCDFELTYVAEAAVGEVELPFSELSCPFCDP